MPAINYTVTRTGDLTRTCTVTWTMSGTVQDADLASGQAKTGTVNWAANEAASKTITINTVGNTADQVDRTCIVTLSGPVNGTLGAASATTTIVDDDATVGSDKLPAGYPAVPDRTNWVKVSVDNVTDLKAEIAKATSAGREITITAAGGYGTIVVNRPNAKIAIIAAANRRPFTSTKTSRAELDGIDLTETSNVGVNKSGAVITNCLVGRNLDHSKTVRMDLRAEEGDILWVEGIDFYDKAKVDANGGYWCHINYTTSDGGWNQAWIKRCWLSEAEGDLLAAGDYSHRGADLLVCWENYSWANGALPTGGGAVAAGVFTDYAHQLFGCDRIILYRCIIHGGYNHGVSTKWNNGTCLLEDCLIAPWHVLVDNKIFSYNIMQNGQEGNKDISGCCGVMTAKGCTFTANSSMVGVSAMFLEIANGMLAQNCMFYPGFTGNGNKFFWSYDRVHNEPASDPNKLVGRDDVIVENCTFRGATVGSKGTPGGCDFRRIIAGTWGGYDFIPRNNIYGGTRNISSDEATIRISLPNPNNSGFT